MKFSVTFCTMDSTLDSGPMGHSCVLLSKLDNVTNLLEVVEAWGYYGMPASDTPGSFTRRCKTAVSLDVDFIHNHGKWKREQTRYLDRGHGLHGHTFELTEDKFNELSAEIKQRVDTEDEAINEAVTRLKLASEKKSPYRVYAYEHLSREIFLSEQKHAKTNQQASRLTKFEIFPQFQLGYFSLFNFHRSYTCKSGAISVLATVLAPEQLAIITEGGRHPTIPRYSGKAFHLFLRSTGNLQSHTKKSGKKVLYRDDIGQDGVRVFWSVHPQLAATYSPQDVLKIEKLVSQAQQIEWILLHADYAFSSNDAQKNELIDALSNQIFQPFARMPANTPEKTDEVTKLIDHAEALLSTLHASMDPVEVQLIYRLENLTRDDKNKIYTLLNKPLPKESSCCPTSNPLRLFRSSEPIDSPPSCISVGEKMSVDF